MTSLNGNLFESMAKISGTLSSSGGTISGDISNNSQSISGNLSSLGIRGYSAYEIAVKYGFQGTEQEWIDLLESRFEIKKEGNIVSYKYTTEDTWNTLIDLTSLYSSISDINDDIDNIIETYIGNINSRLDSLEENKVDNSTLQYYSTKENVMNKIDAHNESSDSHQDIRDLIPTELNELTEDGEHRTVTDEEKELWNNKLSSDTFIPTKMSDLEQDVETGKIDSISVNGVTQTIDGNKNVEITVPNPELSEYAKTSDLPNIIPIERCNEIGDAIELTYRDDATSLLRINIYLENIDYNYNKVSFFIGGKKIVNNFSYPTIGFKSKESNKTIRLLVGRSDTSRMQGDLLNISRYNDQVIVKCGWYSWVFSLTEDGTPTLLSVYRQASQEWTTEQLENYSEKEHEHLLEDITDFDQQVLDAGIRSEMINPLEIDGEYVSDENKALSFSNKIKNVVEAESVSDDAKMLVKDGSNICLTEIPSVPTSEILENTSARHVHINKSVLDSIDEIKIREWNEKVSYPNTVPNINSAIGVDSSFNLSWLKIPEIPESIIYVNVVKDGDIYIMDRTHAEILRLNDIGTVFLVYDGRLYKKSNYNIANGNNVYFENMSFYDEGEENGIKIRFFYFQKSDNENLKTLEYFESIKKYLSLNLNSYIGKLIGVNYDGSYPYIEGYNISDFAKKSDIPTQVTDDHINDLIDAKLGTIVENALTLESLIGVI